MTGILFADARSAFAADTWRSALSATSVALRQLEADWRRLALEESRAGHRLAGEVGMLGRVERALGSLGGGYQRAARQRDLLWSGGRDGVALRAIGEQEAGVARIGNAYGAAALLAERFGERSARSIEGGVGRIAEAGLRTLFGGMERRRDSYWKGFESVGKASFARLAESAIIRPILQPVLAGIQLGGGAGMIGAGGAAVLPGLAAEGGGGALADLVRSIGGALNIFRGGSSATGIAALDGVLNTGLYTMGGGAAAQAFTIGHALSSVGYAFNAINGLRGGNTLGGIGNLASTAMMFIPGAQAFAPFVALGSSLLGGMFGGRKPSNTGSGGAIDLGTGAILGLEDKGANAAARDEVLGRIQDLRLALLRASGGALSGRVSSYVGSRDGYQADVYDAAGSRVGDTVRAKDAGEFLGALALRMAQQLEGASDIVMAAIHGTSDASALLDNIAFARGFQENVEAFRDGLSDVEQQRLSISRTARAEADAAAERIAAFLDTSRALFSENAVVGYRTEMRQRSELRNFGGDRGEDADWREVSETVSEQVPVYQDMSQRAREAEAAVKDLALGMLGLRREGDAFALAPATETMKGAVLALHELDRRVAAFDQVLKEAGYTTAEVAAIQQAATEQVRLSLRGDFEAGLERDIERLHSAAASGFRAMVEDWRQLAADAAALGADTARTAEMMRLQAIAASEGRSLADLERMLALLGELPADAAVYAGALAAVSQAVAAARAEIDGDLTRRAIIATGNEDGAAALALMLAQQKELREAAVAGYDAGQLARLEQVQALERTAAAEKLLAEARGRNLQVLARQIEREEKVATLAGRHAAREAQFQLRLLTGSGSTLAVGDRLALALTAFRDADRAARGNDEEALQALPELRQSVLDLAREMYGASQGYIDIFDEVVASSRDIQAGQDGLLSTANRQLAALQAIQASLEAAAVDQPYTLYGIDITRQPDYAGRLNETGKNLSERVEFGLQRGTLHQILRAVTGYGGAFGNGGWAGFAAGHPGLAQSAMQAAEAFARLFPSFASGGVMTAGGPLPLGRHAAGGIARSPQLALFGEGRQPEAFVPLPDGRSIPVTVRLAGSNDNETRALLAELRALRREVGELRLQQAGEHREQLSGAQALRRDLREIGPALRAGGRA
ncbi:MAG: hypothetical protein LDL44_13680 [Caenispirillum sp.]|nr:hypothetical protein [Caenispirillum sp.]